MPHLCCISRTFALCYYFRLNIGDSKLHYQVIAKPRAAIVQADSDEEALDNIQLSDDGDDETDLVDTDVEILTERKLATFLEQLHKKPDTNQVYN